MTRNRRVLTILLLLTGLLLAACDAVATPTLSPGAGGGITEVVEPMMINSVEVTGLETAPAQPAAAIEGVIGDSCNALDSTTQSRDGNVVSIQINVRRTIQPNVPCAELAQIYNETLPLEGEFPAGDYTLVVNGTATTFTVAGQATPEPIATETCVYNSEFLENVTIPDGSIVVPGEPFTKIWRVRNSGTCAWDATFVLARIEGDSILVDSPEADSVRLPVTQPGEEVEVSAELILLPETPLDSQETARFQMRTPQGELFGAQAFVLIRAGESASEGGETGQCTYDSDFVEDVTIPDGSPQEPGKAFVKTWRIRNTGTCPWDENVKLYQVAGTTILPTGGGDPLPLDATQPGETVDISLELIMSEEVEVGSEQEARFHVRDPQGNTFGTQPFVKVVVAGEE